MSAAVQMAETVFTIGEVADILKISERTVRRWIKRKKLRAFSIPGRGRAGVEWRIPASAIDEATGGALDLGDDQ